MARRVRTVELIKAIGSSGGIAASQLLDATKHVFPFARQHKAASDLTVALELLCIDAEAEWESIYAARVPDEAITARKALLAKLQLEAEHRHFPEGFAPGQKLIDLATAEANAYLSITYDEG